VVAISYFTALLRTNYLLELGVPQEQLLLDKWTFFTIGIILFLVGTVASFFSHDESNEFVQVFKKFHLEEKEFLSLQKEVSDKRVAEKENFDTERKNIQKDFVQKSESLKNRLQELKTLKTEATGNFKKVLTFCHGMERKINTNYKEVIFNYRDTNLTFRNNHKQPKSWSELVPDLQGHFSKKEEQNQSEN
jgi:hypothetical protein